MTASTALPRWSRVTAGALVKTTAVEGRRFLRDPGSYFVLAFPPGLLLVLGAVMPGFRDPVAELGGLRPVDIYVPVVVAVAIGALAGRLFRWE